MPTSPGVQERALRESIKAAGVAALDEGLVALARRLAQLIDLARGEQDEPAVVLKLSVAYRLALAELQLTPASRRGDPAAPAPVLIVKSALQQQRDAIAARRAARTS